jgi:hypothetical protein
MEEQYKQKFTDIFNSLIVIIRESSVDSRDVTDDIYNVTITINMFHNSSIEYLSKTRDIDTVLSCTRSILEQYTNIRDLYNNNNNTTDVIDINVRYYSNVYNVFKKYKQQTDVEVLDLTFSNLSV